MFKGFKDFILRGNVVDLAVAVVIGAAFGTIVTSFTQRILQPLINAITPPESPGFGVQVVPGKESTYVDVASVISAAINFLIVAAVVYFLIVLPLNHLKERRKRGEETGPAEATDVELLTEIRDLLRAQYERAGERQP
ncbi:large conductance mechanosensitive channel protein MscL [Pseudonocardia adelaidensis]|uniref:Large-conductance mechanosensitive channel n=1 Tax=Pseudonocardia adelaidensis TaxID=648754 RepID=A0ABP9P8T6_9PSEU